jgi:glycosyltransferase involved in cell wall biosynthesis
VHRAPEFRCRWFENQTPVVSDAEAESEVAASDLLVAPEVIGPNLGRLGQGFRTVIFNQNAYYTFHGYSNDPKDMRTPYDNPRVVVTLVVSEDNREYLTYAFPGLNVKRLRYGIDSALFHAGEEKRKQICFMPRKHPDEAGQVINLLKFRRLLDGWRIVPLDARSESETAEILRQSLIFLSFGYPEGSPLPPLEVMACGCLTIGYHGMGGREYLTEKYGFPVPIADVVSFARTVERVLREWEADPAPLVDKMNRAADFVRQSYSLENETADILAVWREIVPGV